MTSNVVAKTGVNLQNFTYTYDTIGNLTQRVDVVQSSLTENFSYDRLNRLLQSSGAGLTTQSFSYNALGNMTSKTGAGTYNYPLVTAARPHAPTSITGTVNGFVNPSFTYVDGDLLLWWAPPAKRHIVSRAPELGAPQRGEVVPHPGLVFAASSSVWKVWAVKGRHRPALQTALFQAP